ncbi:hypothetical protein DFJ74DRAFT_247714 [Hyaloraphidium curvatum]|nr:hypothetical protein DFJ74DRAFT_247714 [Hyaloraphidium curvatum]
MLRAYARGGVSAPCPHTAKYSHHCTKAMGRHAGLIALLLVLSLSALADASPFANQVLFARSCGDCAAESYCEFSHPGAPEGHVACVAYFHGARSLYRRYDDTVCTGQDVAGFKKCPDGAVPGTACDTGTGNFLPAGATESGGACTYAPASGERCCVDFTFMSTKFGCNTVCRPAAGVDEVPVWTASGQTIYCDNGGLVTQTPGTTMCTTGNYSPVPGIVALCCTGQ